MSQPFAVIQNDTPWFSEGLRFKCTGCGKCCTGFPGYTWVSREEMETIAKELHITLEEFMKRYVRKVEDRYSLLEHPKTYSCVFLKDNKCQIYSARPRQCRTYPWWQKNLSSKQEWDKAASFCEGINHPDAPVVPAEHILETLHG